ncbi:MAG: endonuclease MutS2 [Clostridia bacterium]|nr:endonuclease MutS2 [Clostridia bacterium]
MNEKTFQALEFERILSGVRSFCINADGKEQTQLLMPQSDYTEAKRLLAETEEAFKILFQYTKEPIFVYDTLDSVLDKAAVFSVLTPGEILKVARLLRASRIFQTTVAELPDQSLTYVQGAAMALYLNKEFEKQVERCILSEDELSDHASEALYQIRRKIRKCNDDIKDKLASYTKSSNVSKYLQDNIVTIRGGRYVIPVKQEYRNMVQGLVHDQSATGATLFMEPIALVEANNTLRMLKSEEQAEIERILQALTGEVAGFVGGLRSDVEILSYWDLVFAKAKYANSIRAICPKLNSNGYIHIISGRHPLISKSKVVPVTIRLGREYRLLVITGPNTGGKTVTLKLTGLFCLMAMCGLFIPCEEGSEVSVFERIYCDVGDEQSIEQSLSTFSSHIKNVSFITENSNASTLILLDELGAGTDPAEGSALALAVTEFLLETGCKGIITTHYGELKEYSLTHSLIENASMDFDPNTFAPTYRLNIGVAGSSNAIEIANRLQLNAQIIQRARSFLSTEKTEFETVLRNAAQARHEAEEEREEIKRIKQIYEQKLIQLEEEASKLRERRESISKNARQEARRIIGDNLQDAEEIIAQMKELLDKEISEQTLLQARQLKKQLENMTVSTEEDEEQTVFSDELIPMDFREIKVGERVYVGSLKRNVIVDGINSRKKEITVTSGSVRTQVKAKDIFKEIEQKQQPKSQQKMRQPKRYTGEIKLQGSVTNEIKLLGKTVDEALPLVDALLDQAYLVGLHEVKIIHGVGTGALGRGIQGHLLGHAQVKSFRYGKYGEGEHGVTIVEIKPKK